MIDPTSENDLLATLRRVVGESSKRRIAKEIGIAHTTLGDLVDPENKRRPYGPTLEKISAFLARRGREGPAPLMMAVREEGPAHDAPPDRLAIALGALEVIRDAADAALRRTGN